MHCRIERQTFKKKTVNFNKYKQKRPAWITQGIIKSIQFRNKLYNYKSDPRRKLQISQIYFFTNIGPELDFNLIGNIDIIKAIDHLENKTSCGVDGILWVVFGASRRFSRLFSEDRNQALEQKKTLYISPWFSRWCVESQANFSSRAYSC